MAQALYRKYRSKSLDTVVGQEHITTTLAYALKTGKLAHAYLFTGPRGVGKTSIARILAHEINGLPYTDDSAHLDIIEIDAASNRRIDEIRELRDKVNVAPSSAKYKVYIIDEVHMLTREAFNALLKTLEEPPAHVVFILATTESHKLPETIVSRTQRFMFKPVGQDKVVAHLRHIADSEGIKVNDEALALIAAHGEGSFRDSISLLDQTRGHDGDIDADYVRQLTGQPTDEAVGELCQAVAAHDAARLTGTLASLRGQGFAAPQVAKRLGQRLRDDAVGGQPIAGVFDLLQKLLDVPSARDPETFLELILLEHALAGTVPVLTPVPQTIAAPITITKPAVPPLTLTTPPAAAESRKPAPVKRAADAPAEDTAPDKTEDKPAAAPPPEADGTVEPEPAEAPPATSVPLDTDTWPQVLARLKESHNTLYGIVRMSRLVFNDDHVALYFKFAFHQKRVNEAKNRDILLAAIRSVSGRDIGIKCLLEEKDAPAVTPLEAAPLTAVPATAPAPSGPVTDPSILAAVNDIFGSSEILGS